MKSNGKQLMIIMKYKYHRKYCIWCDLKKEKKQQQKQKVESKPRKIKTKQENQQSWKLFS